jgi:hypothetical protein
MDTNTISGDCSAGGAYDSGRSDFGSLGFAGINNNNIPAVPEPRTVVLLCVGLLALTLYGRQSRKRVA